ncbi:hypothetical protein [Streptomyces sp. NPDC059080]|uniref:hypothetical protein n=1 Tax=Streptomyces sp. NPDC059080 TaxID=3346718 RepID=UPI00368E0FB9
MPIRHIVPLCAAAALAVSCAKGETHESQKSDGPSAHESTSPQQEETASGSSTSAWNPKRGLQRAQRALDAYDGDGTHPVLVETDNPYITTGMAKKFKATGSRPYRLDITCNTQGIGELTLTFSRGDQEQAYGIGCGDPEADQFNIPPGKPFTANINPVKDGTGLILWRLNTIATDEVDGCDDDIKDCDGWDMPDD